MLALSNLAQPEWKCIRCTDEILDYILCYIDKIIEKEIKHTLFPGNKVCENTQFMKNKTSLQFITNTGEKIMKHNNMCQRSEMKLFTTRNVARFEFIFNGHESGLEVDRTT